MKLHHTHQCYRKAYGKGVIGNLFQSLNGDKIVSGVKDIGKSLLGIGKNYGSQILDAGKNIAVSTGKDILKNLDKDKDKLINSLGEVVKNEVKNITKDLGNVKDIQDINKIIDSSKNSIKNNVRSIARDGIKNANIIKSIQTPLVSAVRDIQRELPVTLPQVNTDRYENLLEADDFPISPTKAVQNNLMASNLISGAGSKKKCAKKKATHRGGKGLSNFGQGLFNFGQDGSGIVQLA